ncbi:Zinc-binding domain [Desmophyllum pertusum]|uniref:Zinc-binding domain n=1 Tax=Desmophyllum pertusum TaxID=174260 RepID=A0A9X0A509_9CNID|nr:Zinc-binding domain [Desmophyllum pertusum]
MASGFDDDTPLSKHWHETFDEIFQAFSPDEWKLEPTDRNMPTEWRRFKDGAKVMFICDCGNSWTSMRGIVIFWFNKIGESERKEEVKTNAETEKNNEGKDGEHCEGEASSKNTIHQYSLRFKVYGQQCQRCDDEKFQNPEWYKEEVTKVLKNVHQKIGEVFYHFPSKKPDDKKRHGRPRRPHDSKRCQACSEGHCSK